MEQTEQQLGLSFAWAAMFQYRRNLANTVQMKFEYLNPSAKSFFL